MISRNKMLNKKFFCWNKTKCCINIRTFISNTWLGLLLYLFCVYVTHICTFNSNNSNNNNNTYYYTTYLHTSYTSVYCVQTKMVTSQSFRSICSHKFFCTKRNVKYLTHYFMSASSPHRPQSHIPPWLRSD